MKRRDFIALIGSATASWSFVSMAQEAGRTYRLGILFPFPREAPPTLILLDELRRRGFIDGQNLTIDYRDFGQHTDLISEYAAQLIKGKPDVLYVGGGRAIRAVQLATKEIPILGITDDMIGEGVVSSLARPGGNTTGVSILATELDGKRLEVLIDAVPGVRRVAALADSDIATDMMLRALVDAARARNVELTIHRVVGIGDVITAAIDSAHASGATAVNVLASPMLYAYRKLIMDRVAQLRLPAVYQWPEMAEEGGFVAYGPRLTKIPELVARVMIKLFSGIKAADTPVEQPVKFELVVNLKTAKALGVPIPETFLVRADKVIE